MSRFIPVSIPMFIGLARIAFDDTILTDTVPVLAWISDVHDTTLIPVALLPGSTYPEPVQLTNLDNLVNGPFVNHVWVLAETRHGAAERADSLLRRNHQHTA